jgi:hypothetical protein
MTTRLYWSTAILIVVGWFSFLRYPHSENPNFYSTAAAVIATLFVAIALSVFASPDPPDTKMTVTHWVFMAASTAGILASLRGLSVNRVHHVWEKELLTALTVVGVTAAIFLVAERLIAWRVARTYAAIFWTVAFVAIAIALAIFP